MTTYSYDFMKNVGLDEWYPSNYFKSPIDKKIQLKTLKNNANIHPTLFMNDLFQSLYIFHTELNCRIKFILFPDGKRNTKQCYHVSLNSFSGHRSVKTSLKSTHMTCNIIMLGRELLLEKLDELMRHVSDDEKKKKIIEMPIIKPWNIRLFNQLYNNHYLNTTFKFS